MPEADPSQDAILTETSHEHPDTTLTIKFDHHICIPRNSSSSCFVFWGLVFGVLGMGFQVVVLQGLGLRVQDFGVEVQRSEV